MLLPRITALIALALLGAGCSTPYTGPIEVTRFVGERSDALGSGTIGLRFSEELTNRTARDALRAAIGNELAQQGYTIVGEGAASGQIAIIESSRNGLGESGARRGPVNVGVGGQAGGLGSGVGLGVGINLGGGNDGPRVVSQLSVAIRPADAGEGVSNLWEGRANLPTSLDSPYAPVEVAARTLAAALFRDFPGGNGETVIIEAEDLETMP